VTLLVSAAVGVMRVIDSLLGKAVAMGGVGRGGNEKAASLGLELLGNRLGKFRRLGDRLALKGLGERLVDIKEVDEEAT